MAVLAACDSVIAESHRANVQRNAQILSVQMWRLGWFSEGAWKPRKTAAPFNTSVTKATSSI
jgi:hypothetical protein